MVLVTWGKNHWKLRTQNLILVSANLKVQSRNQIHLSLQVPKHVLQFIKRVHEDLKTFQQQYCLCHETV